MKTIKCNLIENIFNQNEILRATVQIYTISVAEAPQFNWLIQEISNIEYNEFDGKAAASFLFREIFTKGGPIISIRFGRECSPVMYLEISTTTNDDDFARYMEPKEVEESAKQLLARAVKELKPDEADIVGPGMIRLWWD